MIFAESVRPFVNGESQMEDSSQKFRAVTAFILLFSFGCSDAETKSTSGGLSRRSAAAEPNENVIVSDGSVTIRDGEVTYGPPPFTEDDERKIYKSLSYHLNLAEAIERRVPGGNNGSRQSRETHALALRMFKAQYGLTDAEIQAIMQKGRANGWEDH